MVLNRIVIYPKDVQRITGRSDRYGRKLLSNIKKKLSKEEYQLVTVHEFCEYTGIEESEVNKYLSE